MEGEELVALGGATVGVGDYGAFDLIGGFGGCHFLFAVHGMVGEEVLTV